MKSTCRSGVERAVRGTLAFALLTAVLDVPPAVRADAFSDDTCPNATPIGRHLNDLTAKPSPMSADLMQTARSLANAYRDCVASVDQNQYNNRNAAPAGGSMNDSVSVDRLYARVAYARSLRRVAMFAVESGNRSDAHKAYAAALETLEQAAQIGGSIGPGMSGARHLVDEGRDLESQVGSEDRAVDRAAAGPSPSPSP